MTKGTTSRGTRNDKTHILSRITGRRTYHIQKKKDSVRGRVCLIFYFIVKILFFQVQLVSQSQKTNCSRYRTCPSSQRCKPSFPQRLQRRSNRQEDQEINLACPSIQYCTVLYFRINFPNLI